MAFDFPTAPAVDDAYTDPVSGAAYTFDGEKWNSAGSGGGGGTPPAGGVPEAPIDTKQYGRQDAAWTEIAAAAAGDFLPLTGGTLTGDLTINNGPHKLIFDIGGGSTVWLESAVHGQDATDAIWRIASSTHSQIMNGSAKSQVVNFMAPPVMMGVPIVMKTELDTALARIAALEARLAKAKL